ncbi:hypothetical protein [Methylovirgula sp. 4M-Z18]|nr:hypothetical protein [Methylovirgula sp. 4M-Z18]
MKKLCHDTAVVFAALVLQLGLAGLIFGAPMTLFILHGGPPQEIVAAR